MSRNSRPFLTDQVEVVERIVADLRNEADIWNQKLAADTLRGGAEPHVGQRYRTMYETLRRLANRYESCIPKEKKEST